MMKTEEERLCDLIGKFNSGEISLKEYSKERGISPTEKLPRLYEFKRIAIDYPDMLNLFLAYTSIGIRCMVMKVIFDLNDRQIQGIFGTSRRTIGDFIKLNLTINGDTNAESQRNFSSKTIRELSFIFDLPFRYLSDAQTRYNMIPSFDEYEREEMETTSLEKLVEDTLEYMSRDSITNRKIFGIRLENDLFNNELKYKENYIYTRVDIREKFFTVEMHLSFDTIIRYQVIDKIKRFIKVKCEIYYSNAFLRNTRKLCILISIDDSYMPVLPYLNENVLIDNLMFCNDWRIKKEDMKDGGNHEQHLNNKNRQKPQRS
ncbi:hypothetical protein [Sporosarcina sp. NPDC096371]|uniref:hypothetical protein n=1 Tax=Sporosarcina sp. NPDC096371 TaxID=3364530 RepID=UPI00382AEFC3